jgi:hypothetical protein
MPDHPRGWCDLLKAESGELMYPVGRKVSYWFPTGPSGPT